MNVHRIAIDAGARVRDALSLIDAGGIQFAVVVDDGGRLVATVSDGDIRRALLRGVALDDVVAQCANTAPRSMVHGVSDTEVLREMKRNHLHHMPIVDLDNRLVDLKLLDELIEQPLRPNLVVLMVGGLGTRLGELTRSLPKPMLKVGDRPLLETIIRNFRDQGFWRFRLALNYQAQIIEQHFGDGTALDCEICYLREERRMGTAGALSLLDEPLGEPVIVSNGDLLLRLDYGAMLAQHCDRGCEATMAVRQYEMQIPYGVVRTREDRITGIDEKPTETVMISGGLYVLSPSAVARVPSGEFFDMPALFERVIAADGVAAPYRIDGYWMDIGQLADYERAQHDYLQYFSVGSADPLKSA